MPIYGIILRVSNKKIVLFAYTDGAYIAVAPPNSTDRLYDRFMRARLHMYSLLRMRGFQILVSIAGQASFVTEDGQEYVKAFTVDSDGAPQAPVRLPVAAISVIINRSTLPLHVPGARVMVNDAATCELGNNKHATYVEVFAPNNEGADTRLVRGMADLNAALVDFGLGDVVFKPLNGSLADGFRAVGPPHARRLVLQGLGGDRPYLVQPRLDFTIPWPPSLRPLSEHDTAACRRMYEPGCPKELGMYVFCTRPPTGDLEMDLYPVIRTDNQWQTHITADGSIWGGVDPASVPATLYERSKAVAGTLAACTNARAMYLRLDWGWGLQAGQTTPSYVLVEGNFFGARLLEPGSYPVVGPILHELYADFIVRAANC